MCVFSWIVIGFCTNEWKIRPFFFLSAVSNFCGSIKKFGIGEIMKKLLSVIIIIIRFWTQKSKNKWAYFMKDRTNVGHFKKRKKWKNFFGRETFYFYFYKNVWIGSKKNLFFFFTMKLFVDVNWSEEQEARKITINNGLAISGNNNRQNVREEKSEWLPKNCLLAIHYVYPHIHSVWWFYFCLFSL